MQLDRQRWSFSDLAAVTIAYIVVFSLMEGFVGPLQQMVAPNLSQYVSLLFLPHGIRVLTLYYFGWRGMLYLVPGSLISWFLMVYGQGQPLHFASIFVSIVGCYVGVRLVRAIIGESEAFYSAFSWRTMLIAGAVASLFNSVGLSILHFSAPPPAILIGYFVGDLAGQAALMVMLIFVFRATEAIKHGD